MKIYIAKYKPTKKNRTFWTISVHRTEKGARKAIAETLIEQRNIYKHVKGHLIDHCDWLIMEDTLKE